MKTLVVYDSLYGNTRKIAKAIADSISGEVDLVHMDDLENVEMHNYEFIIIGGPTHSGGISEPIGELLAEIKTTDLQGKKVAAFDTRMTNRLITLFGCAAPQIARELKQKGGILVGKPAGFFVSGGEGPLKEGELERAIAWARKIGSQK